MVAVLSSPVAMLTLVSLAIGLITGKIQNWFGGEMPPLDLTDPGIHDWLETQNMVGYTIGGILGLLLGGPIGAILGITAGGLVVEGGEWVVETTEQALGMQQMLLSIAALNLLTQTEELLNLQNGTLTNFPQGAGTADNLYNLNPEYDPITNPNPGPL